MVRGQVQLIRCRIAERMLIRVDQRLAIHHRSIVFADAFRILYTVAFRIRRQITVQTIVQIVQTIQITVRCRLTAAERRL